MEARKLASLSSLSGLAPLVVAIISVYYPGNMSNFFLKTILALFVIIALMLVSQKGNLDQWFLERLNSWLTVSLFLSWLLGFYGYSAPSTADFLLYSSLTFPGTLYFLSRHFNIKNAVLLIMNLLVTIAIQLQGSWFFYFTIGLFAVLIDLFCVISGRSEWRLLRFTTYLLVIFATLLSAVPGQLVEVLPLISLVSAGILLLVFLIGAVFWMGSQVKLRFNLKLGFSLAALFLISLMAVSIAPTSYLDLLFFALFLIYALSLLNVFGDSPLDSHHRKISVIMPTFNGADTIIETLQSVKQQTYRNWEVIIVNDGSTDQTPEIVQKFIAHNRQAFSYYEEENADQLNAVKLGLQHIKGDIVYVLHSDDKLYDETVFSRVIAALSSEKSDGLFIDIQEMDAHERPQRSRRTKSYYRSQTALAKTALGFGRNPYIDMSYWRRPVFETLVKQNYLTDNLPAWYDASTNQGLRVINGNFIGLRYRIYTGNYLNSKDGSVNVLSGEWRLLHHLLAHFRLPAFTLQSLIYRALNKAHLSSLCPVLVLPGRSPLNGLTQKVAKLRVSSFDHPYVAAITGFAQNYDPDKRAQITIPANLRLYDGADIRVFNRQLEAHQLSPFYATLMKLLSQGTGIFMVKQGERRQLERLLEFFTVKDYVEIEEIP